MSNSALWTVPNEASINTRVQHQLTSHQSLQPQQEADTTEMLRHTLPKIGRPRAKSFVVRIVFTYTEAETYVNLKVEF
jgi:hypothetical protein